MYSLWIAKQDAHVAKYGRNKGEMVNNESYKNSGGFDRLADAQDAFVKALATATPGTKVKLIGTVPKVVSVPKTEPTIAELQAQLNALMAKQATAAKA
jgi:hypothetical protein